jgi:hypothetical protein
MAAGQRCRKETRSVRRDVGEEEMPKKARSLLLSGAFGFHIIRPELARAAGPDREKILFRNVGRLPARARCIVLARRRLLAGGAPLRS